MAQFPNYFQTQQPYNQYGQQYMPNPYMERMAQLQQFQQSLQPQQQQIGITGKVVENGKVEFILPSGDYHICGYPKEMKDKKLENITFSTLNIEGQKTNENNEHKDENSKDDEELKEGQIEAIKIFNSMKLTKIRSKENANIITESFFRNYNKTSLFYFNAIFFKRFNKIFSRLFLNILRYNSK